MDRKSLVGRALDPVGRACRDHHHTTPLTPLVEPVETITTAPPSPRWSSLSRPSPQHPLHPAGRACRDHHHSTPFTLLVEPVETMSGPSAQLPDHVFDGGQDGTRGDQGDGALDLG